MAKTKADYEKEFLDTLEETLGKNLEEWMGILSEKGEAKTPIITKFLKTEHGFNHHQATLLAGIFKNGGKPVFQDNGTLISSIFEGKEHQEELFEEIKKKLVNTIKDVYIGPTKTYIEFKGKKLFGCAKIMKKSIRIGMDLGDLPFDDYVQKGKGLGTMPRISHMIEVQDKSDVNENLINYLSKAYKRVHPST